MRYFLLDVFCKEKYSGNQLAVVVVEDLLSTETMQAIANEFHYSETTFILVNEKQKDAHRVRIFTPLNEVPFAGHPTLGTAFVIRNEIEVGKSTEVLLNLNAGGVRVIFDDKKNLQWMKQIEPSIGQSHSIQEVAEIIGVSSDAIDSRFPIQSISTGLEFLIIPMKRLDAVKKASTNLTMYEEYFKGTNPLPILIFCPETYEDENSLNCRMFADVFGIPEDPATGSANGCLSAYLTHHKYFGTNSIDITVEQGYEIGRKSILHIQSHFVDMQFNIMVGGKVIKTAEGRLF